jgi:phage baseplate assembly protein W
MDLNHFWSGDLAIASNGDLSAVDTSARNQQRILRRLMTCPGDYVQHPEYGAGLPQLIGQVFNAQKIGALIRGQMFLESCVSKSPEPQITVQQIAGGMSCNIQYTDAQTNTSQILSFNVKA